MTPELDTDLRALESASEFAEVKDAYARVQAIAPRRSMLFLGQILPLALAAAALIFGAQHWGWLPKAEWVMPFGSMFGAVLGHTILFRTSMIEHQRIGAALQKWRAAAQRPQP